MNKTIRKIAVLILVIFSGLAVIGCSREQAAPETAADSAQKAGSEAASSVVADLTVPPPGSQATQEKWDSFTEDKKKESWDKYIESLSSDSGAPAETVSKTTSTEKTVSVIVAPLSSGPMEIYYYGIGEVEAGKTTRVYPAVSGTAETIYVREGDYVEFGDLLFALDSRDWVTDIERAEEKWNTELNLAEIRLNEANQEYERTKTFFERDLVTRQELDKATQNVTEAQVNYEKIRISRAAELETLQEGYKSRLGASPGRGYISSISFGEGEAINSSDFVEIVNLEEVQLNVDVPENIIPRVTRGAAVLAKTPSSSRYGMEGEVSGYSILPGNNRTYKVTVTLINKNQRLFPGMLMEAQIQVSQLQPRFIVPRPSVITEGTDSFVYIVENNQSIKVPVDLGSGRQGFTQVDGDLYEGAQLVIDGQSYLRQGTPVNVTDTREYLPDRTEL